MIPNTKIDHSRDALVARLIAATDADRAGDRYADLLHALAAAAGVQAVRLRPPAAAGDWNEVLVRARQGR